jgi:hypothetical protein
MGRVIPRLRLETMILGEIGLRQPGRQGLGGITGLGTRAGTESYSASLQLSLG